MENIHSVLPVRASTYFYRAAGGAEIDLIITLPRSQVWAAEITYGLAPKLSPHYKTICKEVGATQVYIVYGGDDAFSIGQGIEVLSLRKLLQKLQSF